MGKCDLNQDLKVKTLTALEFGVWTHNKLEVCEGFFG